MISKILDKQNLSKEEITNLYPILTRISTRTKRKLNKLNSQLSYHKTNSKEAIEIQNLINKELSSWSDNVRRLGGIPISIFKVRFIGNEEHYLWELGI